MNIKQKKPFLGAHTSISGGFTKSIDEAELLGCEAIQIFSKNQMRWKSKDISGEDAADFIARRKKSRVKYVLIHDSYLINLGNPDEAKREKAVNAFIDEIKRAKVLHADYLIFHPGSHLGIGDDDCLKLVADSLKYAIENDSQKGELMVLIETTAGQGTNVGYKFNHLSKIIDLTNNKSVGVCIDTCHIFAAGYDIREKAGYERTMSEFESIIGLPRLKAFHLNDSKTEFGSRKDRHENIGKGFIGKDAFSFLLNDIRMHGIPMVLETPGGIDAYKTDLYTLKNLFQN